MNKMSGDIHNRVENVPDDLLEPENDDHKTLDTFTDDPISETTKLAGEFLRTTAISLNTQTSTVSTASDGSMCCEICNIRVTSSKILQRHLEGRKHKSKAERRGKTFYCDVCDVTANSEIQLNIHLSSSKHKSRVAREEFKELFDVSSYSKSFYVILFAVLCVIINLIILFRVAM